MNTLVKTNGGVNYTNSFNNLLEGIFNGEFPSVLNSYAKDTVSVPKANIKENADKFEIELAVPGIKKEAIRLNIDKKIVSVSTEVEKEIKGENFIRNEFNYTSFKRSFKLPNSINESKIEANYNNGVLTILLPKKEEAKEQPERNIEIS